MINNPDNIPTLYTFLRCPYAIRARMALNIAGIKAQHIEVDLKNKPKELLRLSPKGQVPVLKIVDNIIEESLDIMIWALKQHDPEGWLPQSKPQWQQYMEQISNNDDLFKPALDICKYHTRYHNNQVREAQVLAQNQLIEWEQILMRQPFFQGPRLGMIDIACFPFIRQFAHITPDIFSPLPIPKMQQWLHDRCQSEIFKQSMVKN
jgi:glutathione S-transferase